MIEHRIYAGTYNNLYVSMFEHESVTADERMSAIRYCCCCFFFRLHSLTLLLVSQCVCIKQHTRAGIKCETEKRWERRVTNKATMVANKKSKLNKTNNPRKRTEQTNPFQKQNIQLQHPDSSIDWTSRWIGQKKFLGSTVHTFFTVNMRKRAKTNFLFWAAIVLHIRVCWQKSNKFKYEIE